MEWVPAVLFQPERDRLVCTLCPTQCKLSDGQSGACHVRRRSGDILETRTFATTVWHWDAVERKPLYHYRPGSTTLTLAAPGCTFRCDYCVNYRISQFGRDEAAPWQVSAVDPDTAVEQAAAAGASIALSYSEPSLAMELTLALASRGRERGVGVLWKTNGFMTPEALSLAGTALDAVNIDIKAADEERHRRLTGAPLAPVMESLRALHDMGVWVEASTPLVPGVADQRDDLARIADRIAAVDPDIPWHLVRFTPAYRRADDQPTLPGALAAGVRLGREAGLRYVYVERALGPPGRATCCPGCGATVVIRDVWSTAEIRLAAGKCRGCGQRVEGRWLL